MGAPGGRPPSVRASQTEFHIVLNVKHFEATVSLIFFVLVARLETVRHVSMITVTLSKKEPDTKSVG